MIKSKKQHLTAFQDYKDKINKVLLGQLPPDCLGKLFEKMFLEKKQVYFDINRFNILEETTFRRDKVAYKNFLYQQALNEIDKKLFLGYTMDELLDIKNLPENKGPYLFFGIHSAGFMHLPTAIKQIGYDALMMSWMNNAQQTINIEDTDPELQAKKSMVSEGIIDIKEFEGIFQIYKAVKKGKSVICLLDLSSNAFNEKRIAKVKFGRYSISAPQHIFDIAETLNIPIIPVFTNRNKDLSVTIDFHSPIRIAKKDDADKNAATQHFFDLLKNFLALHYDQWSELPFVNAWTQKVLPVNMPQKKQSPIRKVFRYFSSRPTMGASLEFDSKRFELYQDKDEYFLVDVNSLFISKISRPVFTILKDFQGKAIPRNEALHLLGQKLLYNLFSKSIIKSANHVYI